MHVSGSCLFLRSFRAHLSSSLVFTSLSFGSCLLPLMGFLLIFTFVCSHFFSSRICLPLISILSSVPFIFSFFFPFFTLVHLSHAKQPGSYDITANGVEGTEGNITGNLDNTHANCDSATQRSAPRLALHTAPRRSHQDHNTAASAWTVVLRWTFQDHKNSDKLTQKLFFPQKLQLHKIIRQEKTSVPKYRWDNYVFCCRFRYSVYVCYRTYFFFKNAVLLCNDITIR